MGCPPRAHRSVCRWYPRCRAREAAGEVVGCPGKWTRGIVSEAPDGDVSDGRAGFHPLLYVAVSVQPLFPVRVRSPLQLIIFFQKKNFLRTKHNL